MGAQESLRGYIIQTIVAILESLQTEWENICIEPDTENEKVDIIWTDSNSNEKIYQVKSSINDFGKPEIQNYLLDLQKENQNAVSFRVILVGNASSITKDFYKNIGKKELADFGENYKSLYQIRDKIKVEFYNLDINTLKGAIISNIDRFLSLKNVKTDYFTKELIYSGLMSQFMYFSTSGKKISRAKFENELLNWVNHNYSKNISKSNSELLLSFYLTGFSEFENNLSTINIPSIEDISYVKEAREVLRELYKKALLCEVKIKPKEEIEDLDSPFGELLKPTLLNGLNRAFPPYKKELVIVSEYDKENIKEKAKFSLNIDISDDLFEFGELRESNNSQPLVLFGGSIILHGTESEKNKKEIFDDFILRLKDLYDLLNYWSKLRELNFLPIVLRNESNSFEKGLKIKLFFPKNVKIVLPRDFPCPQRLNVLKNFNESDNILNQMFKHHKDSKVNESFSKRIIPQYFNFESYYTINSLSASISKKISMRIEQYYKIIEYWFDFDVHFDNPKYTILECEIDELSANEAISLPSFIFYKSNSDFDIEYEINSKILPKKINGILKVSDNHNSK